MKLWAMAGALACLATAGCGILDFSPRTQAAQQPDMSGYFADRLDAGRAHLAAGRPGRAIEAFRQASYDPALAPDAFNGMAVAYTTLGRNDVARDLFLRAMELDPTDTRYSRNLAKLEENIMLAQRAALPVPGLEAVTEDAPVAEVPVALPAVAAMAPPRVTAAGARPITTARAREVFIRTLPDAPTTAPRGRVAERKLAGAIVRAPVMVGAARPQTAQPIRIPLTGARRLASAANGTAKGTSQPVRIYLDKK